MDDGKTAAGKFGFPVLRLKSEFDAVKNGGEAVKVSWFTLLYLPDDSLAELHCGIICSRRFHIRAVRRNRAKRILREALRTGLPDTVKPGRILLIPKRSILTKSMPEVRERLLASLMKAGAIPPDMQPGSSCC